MESTSVQHHTISQLLAAMGAGDDGSGFHVFEKKDKPVKIPIKYPFRSDHFSFLLVTHGQASLRQNLLDYTLQKNDLLIISPNDVRQFQQVSEDCTFIGIGSTHDFLANTGIHKKNIDAFGFFSSQASPLLQLQENDIEVLLALFTILCKKSNEKSNVHFQHEVIRFTFNALIFEIATLFRMKNKTHIKITRKEDLAMRFLKLLPIHFQAERTLKFYADSLFVTPKYLTQTMKKATGKTAGEFIDEMVIMEAKVLLNDLSKSIGQVAQELHFTDQFVFSKFFKKHVHSNPSDYRSSL